MQDSFHSDIMERREKKDNRQIKTNLCISIQIESKVQIFNCQEDNIEIIHLNEKSKELKC